jgi:hypothetical protein
MPISCKYTKPDKQCGYAVWVIALLCDRCEGDATVELCDVHYNYVWVNTDTRLACSDCQGTISYIAERIDHSVQSEVIN